MHILKGITASGGIAIGNGLIYKPFKPIPIRKSGTDPQFELNRLNSALQKGRDALDAIYQAALEKVGAESAEIFQAHRMMLDDPDLLDSVKSKILTEHINADSAFYEASEDFALMLESLEDTYLRERAADIRDIAFRMVSIIQDKPIQDTVLTKPTIILAEDLAPSDTMKFNKTFLLGFVTSSGGTTSHTAILSKALGIPAIVGAGILPNDLDDETLILDGDTGQLIIGADESLISKYKERLKGQLVKSAKDKALARQPAITKDGNKVEVVANIGNLEDARVAIENGAEGVGLLRTEFSYIEQIRLLNEDELVQVYSEIIKIFGDYPVVIRTLDIGGDKEVSHLNLPVESNPFLGIRGIRLCFDRMDLFEPQLRAILRAGIGTHLCIMFPMIATIEEVRKARSILNTCMESLRTKNQQYNPNPEVGIMIEVPGAAMCADQLAKEVDFFSIGTNDLTQYTLAADRTNKNLSYLISSFQPAVLRLIKRVIDAGHDAGIWVGMCGEMAGEALAIPILLGMGLDEFSMNAPAIPQAKEIIRQCDTKKTKLLAEQALQCETPQEVEVLVTTWMLED